MAAHVCVWLNVVDSGIDIYITKHARKKEKIFSEFILINMQIFSLDIYMCFLQ